MFRIALKILHHSQKIIDETTSYFSVELFVHPTFDFILELLKYGELVEVLEPKELRATIKERIENAAKLYN